MWKVPVKVDGFNGPINYPSICPLTPARGKAFCSAHIREAKELSIPTDIKEFLQSKEANNDGEGTYFSRD